MLFVALFTSAFLGLWFSAPEPQEEDLLEIIFAGNESDHPYRAAKFTIANRGKRALATSHIHTEIFTNGVWTARDTVPIEREGTVWRHKNPTVLESGEKLNVIVEWPEVSPWRVGIHYSRELRGAKTFAVNLRNMWTTRSLAHWGIHPASFGEGGLAISKVIAE